MRILNNVWVQIAVTLLAAVFAAWLANYLDLGSKNDKPLITPPESLYAPRNR